MTANLTLMDGGMGTALRMRFPEKLTRDPLWSARMLTNEDGMKEVQKLHEEFLDAGAEIVITNNYACVPLYLDNAKEFDCLDLTRRAVDLACAAVASCGKGKVLLSLPPLRQSYSPEVPPFDEAVAYYNQVAREFGHKVDSLIAETVAAAPNAEPPCVVAAKEGLDILMSYTVNEDGSLRSGECITEAVNLMENKSLRHQGVLVNCSTPEATTSALEKLLSADRLSASVVGCYPNSFKPIPADWNHHKYGPPTKRDLAIPEYIGVCQTWHEMVRKTAASKNVDVGCYIGGCCGILPQHISALATAFGKPKRETSE